MNIKEAANEQVDGIYLTMRGDYWTACDYKDTPMYSCLNCHTRLICKPYGGIAKSCGLRYCRDGFCSGIPDKECD